MEPSDNRSAWVKWLFGPTRAMRIRVVMTLTSALLCGVCGAVIIMLSLSGIAPLPLGVAWLVATGLFNAVVLWAIRSGRTAHLADPALTQLQILFAVIANAVSYVFLGEARGISPVILSLALMFGVFSLSMGQMLANLFVSLLCYGIALVVTMNQGGHQGSTELQLAYGVTIVLVLVGCTFVGLRMQQARERLQAQKKELAQALLRIEHLAAHDALTGLVNRRRMGELLAAEQRRCARSQRPLVLALLDLDHFKQINDRHGHAAGDTVLQAFAQCALENLRATDTLARWGGEEFLLLMPETPPQAAAQLLERLRAKVAALSVPGTTGDIAITVSIGLAAGASAQTLEGLLEAADLALYQAKAEGRNRVCVAKPENQ